MTTHARPALMLAAALAAVALTGCSQNAQDASEEPAASPSSVASNPRTADGTTEPSAAVDTVPGYDVGEFPPVPLFLLPDTSLLDRSSEHFAIEAGTALADIPGVTATPARCDAEGTVLAGSGVTTLYGDGSGSHVDDGQVIDNDGDGSGSYVDGSIVVTNNGDGSGSFVNETVVITNNGDGTGSYVDGDKVIEVAANGSGSSVDGDKVIENDGDGSGSYTDASAVIENNGDGSGSYVGDGIVIENNGDGTGTVNGTEIEVAPLPPVQKLGAFPPIDALQPIESCGTTLTFEDGVLFDFDRSDIRADASATLPTVADVLGRIDAPDLVVSGHTDAIGDDAYNQTLSEARAAAVVAALQEQGVTATMTAEGYGESRPVAANEVDGADNPAGRQLNRRVEIFIPTAL